MYIAKTMNSIHEPSIVQIIKDTSYSPDTSTNNQPVQQTHFTPPSNSQTNFNGINQTTTASESQNEPSSQILGMDILANKNKQHQSTNNATRSSASSAHPEHNFNTMDSEEEEHAFSSFQETNNHFNAGMVDDDNSERSDNSIIGEDSRVFDESHEDVVSEKRKLLFKIYCMERKGITLTKKFTMMNSLEELQNEYDRVAHQHNVTSSIRFSRKMLMMSVTAMEYLNDKFDPFDIQLHGWSENVHENIVDYDDVFSELYEKYHTKAQIAPEVKLMLMLGGSGFMFHLSNSMFKQGQFGGMRSVHDPRQIPQQSMAQPMAEPVGVDDILSELKNSRDLDSMSDDSQSIVSTTSDKYIKLSQSKKGKRTNIHLDL